MNEPDRRLYGVYSGVVADNRDPEQLGRLKVALPWLPGDYVTDWTRVATAMGGSGFGAYFLPEPGDEVLLAFDHGDPARPVVLASLWGADRRPPEANADGRNDRRLIRSRSGHQILLDDTDGREQVVVTDRTGQASVTLDSATGDIVLGIGGEQLRLRGGGGTITVTTSAAIRLEAPSLEAALDQTARVEAAQLELTATTGLALTCLAGVRVNDGALEVV